MLDDAAYAALCSAVTLQSNENGFFRDVADDVVEMAGAEWLRRFADLASNRERIAECFTDERIKHGVRRMMENVRQVYRGKSATVSRQRRLEAQRLYADGKTDQALAMFTQSVVKAPSAQAEEAAEAGKGRGGGVDDDDDDGRSLAAALWGRCQILYERGESVRCLEDVTLSLREKLPQKFRLEAYLRMAECCTSAGRLDQARVASGIVSRLLAADGDDRRSAEARARNRRIHDRLNELASATATTTAPAPTSASAVDHDHDHDHDEDGATATATAAAYELAGGEHARLKRVSRKLALAETKEAGRFLVAAEAIRTGDTLVVEEAYVACLSVDRFGSHCHHCMRRLETAMPCRECSAVAFCSLACRTAALDSYHRFECRYVDLLIGSGMSVLCFAALRILSQQSVAYFEAANLVDDDTADALHPYSRIYGMVRHERRRSPDDFFRRTLMAIFLSTVLAKSGYLDAGVVPPTGDNSAAHFGTARQMLVAAVLLRNLEVLQFNAHEISETIRTGSGSGNAAKTSNIGVGLYASASFFNHDCFPAVTRFFRGSTLVVRAVRPLRERRAVVGDCYGPALDKFDGPERRRRLRARYRFECRCQACQRDWPSAHQLARFQRIRCGGCAAEMDDARRPKKGDRCGGCGADAAAEYEAASRAIAGLRTRLQTAAENATPQAIGELCDAVDSADARLCPPHQLHRRVADVLTRLWSQPPAQQQQRRQQQQQQQRQRQP